jgi:hypothetical protein
VPDAAGEILIAGATALAHVDGLEPGLQVLTDALARAADAVSAVVVIAGGHGGGLKIAASVGLGDAARTGLTEAMQNRYHPIARTAATAEAGFDVQPTAPGGPALRSHLPLVVTRGGTTTVLGVLALAHERPIPPALRPILQAGADLAGVLIERDVRPTG